MSWIFIPKKTLAYIYKTVEKFSLKKPSFNKGLGFNLGNDFLKYLKNLFFSFFLIEFVLSLGISPSKSLPKKKNTYEITLLI